MIENHRAKRLLGRNLLGQALLQEVRVLLAGGLLQGGGRLIEGALIFGGGLLLATKSTSATWLRAAQRRARQKAKRAQSFGDHGNKREREDILAS